MYREVKEFREFKEFRKSLTSLISLNSLISLKKLLQPKQRIGVSYTPERLWCVSLAHPLFAHPERSDQVPLCQPTLRSESRECLYSMPSREEKEPPCGGLMGNTISMSHRLALRQALHLHLSDDKLFSVIKAALNPPL